MTFIANVMLIAILCHINKLPYCEHHITNIKTLNVLPFIPKRNITKVIIVNIWDMTLIFENICYLFLRSADFKIALLGVPLLRKWDGHMSVCVERNFILIFSPHFFLVPLFSGLKLVETMLIYSYIYDVFSDIIYIC